ncbi:hypothetical protein Cpir12675_000539 [Ceratocystis pirilliformis]|uniref:Uncharacterized protein n=1 Tax=Ceratocystis pirilliformis TaxID=259994 RepID=A0ABR3ZKW8_9PEZI
MPKFLPARLSPLALAVFPRASIGFVPMVELQHIRMSSGSSRLPSIAQPSLWFSMLPKSLRQRRGLKKRNQKSIMERMSANPATFFMAMFILIGSMSINLLGMKNEFATFTRRTDTRICLLKEVIERLQAGEKFDVDRALGAGDEDQEREWEDVVGQFVGGLSSAEKSDTEEKHKNEAAPISTNQPESVTETPSRKNKGLSSFF